MRNFVLICMLFFVNISAKTTEEFIKEFKNKKYDIVCTDGLKQYYGGRQDELFISMVGIACANIDNINPLGTMQSKLVSTKESRETASYFASLLLSKRLIYQFMIDDISLKALQLPKSNHILSFVFEHLGSGNFVYINKNPKMIKIDDGGKSVLLSVSDDEVKKVLIDEYKGATLIKRHWFQ
ncbi:hypothetical protein [Sulfurimonas sp. HSL-1716]|uniref:hypothetical protein n=1 Tax=Hydrocurvibacter sulfurireducens TaxID=3131937 RepID=UPI0031F916B2